MLKIERAQLEDVTHLTQIKTRAFNQEVNKYLGRDGGPVGYNQEASERYIIENFLAYKILLNQKIIGGFFLEPLERHKIRFEDFVIVPEEQNKGYGYQVMQIVEAAYPNVWEWELSTPVFSLGNQHLYTKLGYQEVARDDEEVQYLKKIK